MSAQWFVRAGGKVFGPFDSARLKSLVAEGKINKVTEIAQSSNGPWGSAGNVKGLFAGPAASPPPAPIDAAVIPSEEGTPRKTLKPRPWYRRRWATFVLFPFLAFMACGILIQLTVPKETLDRWKAEAEERRQKQAAAPSQKNGTKGDKTPPGFTMGFLTGAMAARDGARKPSADEVDAMARRSATENTVAERERGAWIANFKTAFWMGWRKGQ
jgi:hypothetical protein